MNPTEAARPVPPARRRWPGLLFFLSFVFVFALDQATKAWAVASLRPVGQVTLLPGYFDLTYAQNKGVAFGMFAEHAILVAVFVIVLGLVALYFSRGIDWTGWEPNVVGGCLVGGAVGNLFDRVRLGSVVDFFDVHLGVHHWPIFNIADSFICVAVAWIVIRQLTAK